MKVVAFFVCLITVFCLLPAVAAQQNHSYAFETRTIVLERQSNGALKIMCEETPEFTFLLGDQDRRYTANGVIEDGEYLIVYGYFHDVRHETYYDAFVLVLSDAAELVTLAEFDFGALEEVSAAFTLTGIPLFQMDVLVETQDQYAWETHYIVVFAADYKSYRMVEVADQIVRRHIEGDRVYLSDWYHGSYHRSIDADLVVYHVDRLYGVVDQTEYTGVMHIRFVETAWLNDTAYLRSITLDIPGHYTIDYQDVSVAFTLHPEVTGVEAGLITHAPVTVNFSGGRAYLNDDIYHSGTRIERPGDHSLEFEGVNGYYQRLEFTITADLHGVYDMQQYDEARTLTFRGVGYLNNRYIESGYEVSEPGIYTLRILGENGYEETHHFEILAPVVNRPFWRNTLMMVEVGLLATALGVGGVWLFKSKFKS